MCHQLRKPASICVLLHCIHLHVCTVFAVVFYYNVTFRLYLWRISCQSQHVWLTEWNTSVKWDWFNGLLVKYEVSLHFVMLLQFLLLLRVFGSTAQRSVGVDVNDITGNILCGDVVCSTLIFNNLLQILSSVRSNWSYFNVLCILIIQHSLETVRVMWFLHEISALLEVLHWNSLTNLYGPVIQNIVLMS